MPVVAVREIDSDLDPFPAFGGDLLRFGLQLRGDQAVKQSDILQPAAIVILEEIAQDITAGLFIGVEADKKDAFVRGPDGALGQHASNLEWRSAVGVL